MPDLVDSLLEALAGLQPAVLYLLTGLVVTLETSLLIGLLLPGDSVVLLAGTTVTGPSRFAALVAVSTIGSLLGESIGYLLGSRYGRRVRASRAGRRLGEDAWARAESFLAGRGGRSVAAARFVAVVHAVVPVVAGSVGMPYRRFLGWSALGAAAWSTTYVGLGALAGASWRQYGDRLGMAVLAVLALAALAAWLLRSARRRRRRPAPGSPSPRDGDAPDGRGAGDGRGASRDRAHPVGPRAGPS